MNKVAKKMWRRYPFRPHTDKGEISILRSDGAKMLDEIERLGAKVQELQGELASTICSYCIDGERDLYWAAVLAGKELQDAMFAHRRARNTEDKDTFVFGMDETDKANAFYKAFIAINKCDYKGGGSYCVNGRLAISGKICPQCKGG